MSPSWRPHSQRRSCRSVPPQARWRTSKGASSPWVGRARRGAGGRSGSTARARRSSRGSSTRPWPPGQRWSGSCRGSARSSRRSRRRLRRLGLPTKSTSSSSSCMTPCSRSGNSIPRRPRNGTGRSATHSSLASPTWRGSSAKPLLSVMLRAAPCRVRTGRWKTEWQSWRLRTWPLSVRLTTWSKSSANAATQKRGATSSSDGSAICSRALKRRGA
mmetsp:Transcript_131481/g.420676  ORF Transcript_131481/g.420676 Transcript_131481/m.420676 type:complete len:216 (-) Transcript_131481:2544-3191(-)